MKLINVDDIKYQMLYKENFLSGTGVEAQAVWKSDIDSMPAVDAVPVVHGAWVIDGEFIDCSVCNREKWSRVPYEDLVKRFKYCPNCGAKMDGERKDDD